jgi:hypothetical protein
MYITITYQQNVVLFFPCFLFLVLCCVVLCCIGCLLRRVNNC